MPLNTPPPPHLTITLTAHHKHIISIIGVLTQVQSHSWHYPSYDQADWMMLLELVLLQFHGFHFPKMVQFLPKFQNFCFPMLL